MPLTVTQLAELKQTTPGRATEDFFALAKKEETRDEYRSHTITRDFLETILGRMEERPAPSQPKTVHFVVAHTKEHSALATSVRLQLLSSVENLFPDLELTAELLLIGGTDKEVIRTLIAYNENYSAAPADKTFIVTPGWKESQMVSEAIIQRACLYPQLFCVSGMPGQLLYNAGIQGSPFKSLSGVYSTPCAPSVYVNSVLGFKPKTTRVCIAYEKNAECPAFQKHIAEQVVGITQAFEEKGVAVVTHNWTTHDAKISELRDILYDVSSIIILNEPAAEVHRERLVRLCNAHKKFICASELDSVYAGAALGGGIPSAAFGVPLAGLVARHLLLDHSGVEITGWMTHKIPEQSGMRYNEWAFGMQDIQLTPQEDALMRMQSAFNDHCVEY